MENELIDRLATPLLVNTIPAQAPMPLKAKPWLFARQPQQSAGLRLFCFPYGGGGASAYRTWQQKLGNAVEVCAVQLPGRENRYAEPLCDDVEHLMQDMLPALLPLLDGPLVFLGYSMGAAIAYQLATWCKANCIPIDLKLIIACARKPPEPASSDNPLVRMSDSQFLDYIVSLGGADKELLRREAFRDMSLRLLRSDFRLSASVLEPRDGVLDVNLLAIGGTDDATVSPSELQSWGRTTTGRFTSLMLPGGHFTMINESDSLLETISPILSTLAADSTFGQSVGSHRIAAAG